MEEEGEQEEEEEEEEKKIDKKWREVSLSTGNDSEQVSESSLESDDMDIYEEETTPLVERFKRKAALMALGEWSIISNHI